MPASDSPAIIVARYLKANNLTESYDAFISEAGLPVGSGNISKGDLTLETLLEEKKTFDISIRFEKLGVEDEASGWSRPAPSQAVEVNDLPSRSNILAVQLDALGGNKEDLLLLASTADRRLNVLDGKTHELRASLTTLHDSPILSCRSFLQKYILTTSMSGQLHLSDVDGKVVAKRQDHTKFVVKVAVFDDVDETVIATAGWDSKINLYKVSTSGSSSPQLGDPFASIPLATKPEAMIFLRDPNSKPILLLSRTDSSFIFFYTVEETPQLLGKQNLAPHSNAWVAFTPSAFETCPSDPSLLAVATSSVPHMKVLVVRLLFPANEKGAVATPHAAATRSSSLDDSPATETQASQARAALAVADREAAAIQIHCTTMAPQTAYSTPAIAWRPDGSGLWVNGDDGIVRGIEAQTGKVVAKLQGHEPGSKIRCICAGVVDGNEIVVSGGFDQKLIFWRPESEP